ncbi:FHF complex subunit HOOK-interacting protein 1A-like [Eucyclogobius newberryi]|uniref:FHF complex subunit HOOK-interacting protein 1A-like n=1 Tax=Eucyclogobius newberryi TaxID=166745 RepID=UPI003B5AC7CE
MMASAGVGGHRRKSLTLKGVDPETCMIVFRNHWAQVVKILEKHEQSRHSSGTLGFLSGHVTSGGSARVGAIPADEASAVQNYVEHMLFLLMEEEAGQGGAMGPILELVVLEGVLERLFLWSLRRQFTEDMKLEQLRMYQMLLSRARQPLLHHKPVLRPLMMLLASCAGAGTGAGATVESELVLLLHQLCAALVKDPSVLELFFHTSEDQGAANFLLFSLLIPYTHRQGLVGRQARDALLLIMSLSASDLRVAQHIAENTYFCPVLATGLSGLYSSLPTRLQVYSDDWHCLEPDDWQQVPALVHFLHSLDFCGAVTKAAHPSIRSQLLGYIYNGFLVPVLAPALHKLTVEEAMTTTAYLDLFLRSVREPALLQTFLSFVLLHAHDHVHILDTLVSRVNTPFQLGTVSLALFRTLIGLFCEDVMLQLVFRFLVPYSDLSRPTDCASSAVSLLRLMPSWCSQTHSALQHSEHVHWPKGTHPSASDIVRYYRSSDLLTDVNYLHYLWDARLAIATAHRACQLWSAPYDGSDPAPDSFRCETPGIFIEDEDDDEDLFPRSESSSARPFAATPPPFLLSPTPSSASAGNQAARPGSALDLEWDELFDDDENRGGSEDRPGSSTRDPPKHIQEMRRDAIKLVRGSYVEEAEFEDDVLVYDLVARKDTEAAPTERVTATQNDIEIVQKKKSPVKHTLASMLTTTGKSVLETVNSIMSTRRSEDAGNDDKIRIEVQDMPKSHYILTNDFHMSNNIFKLDSKCDYNLLYLNNLNKVVVETVEDNPVFCNGRVENEPEEQTEASQPQVPNEADFRSDGFMFQYEALMRSLGAEPDAEEFTDDIGSFRRRVRALRRKLQREEEEEETRLCEDALSWGGGDEGGGVEMEEAERGEETRSNARDRIPLTGPFISVLLSRLENLLENSIAVNLLVTGILAQLASYPQPLLRGFLLGTDTSHAHANVRTLFQVLVSVRDQMERFLSERPEYPALVLQAWRFLLIKDQDKKLRERLQSGAADASSGLALPNGSVHVPPLVPPLVLPPCPAVPPQAQSRVFAIVLYAEFLKELAAIAQEHSVAPDVQEGRAKNH